MKLGIFFAFVASAILPASVFAGPAKDFKQIEEPSLFKDTELQVDAFASYGYGDNKKTTKTFSTTSTKVTKTKVAPPAAPTPTPPPTDGEGTAALAQFRTTTKVTLANGQVVTRTTTQKDHTVTTGHTGLFEQDNAFGGGIAANYFFARYFGIGAEADWLAGASAIHLFDSNFFLRYPISFSAWGGPRGLAPYVFGGYGLKFDGVKWGIAHAGAGSNSASAPASPGFSTAGMSSGTATPKPEFFALESGRFF